MKSGEKEQEQMNLIQQSLNIQEYGAKGGQMNLEQVRGEILKDYSEKQKKKE